MKHKEMTAGERTAYGQGYRAAEKKIIEIFKNKMSQTVEDFLRVLDLALQNGDEKRRNEMLNKLKEICGELEKIGKSNKISVIREIWEDGGGSPVYLEDVIVILEKYQAADVQHNTGAEVSQVELTINNNKK